MKVLNLRCWGGIIAIFFCISITTLNAQSPIISFFSPTSKCPGTSANVLIIGSNFTGATAVTIGGKAVSSFTVNSGTSITATTALNSVGAITVTTPNGIVTSASAFTDNGGYNVYAYIEKKSGVSVINTATNATIATIPLTSLSYPQGICISTDGSKLYVPSEAYNTLNIINTSTNKITASVGVGFSPIGVAVSPDGSKVYVINSMSFGSNGTVSVINTATDSVVATFYVGEDPLSVIFSPDGSKAYVANYMGNSVSVINTATNTVTAAILVGASPLDLVVSPDGSKVYVSNSGDSSIGIINTTTNTVTAKISVGRGPSGLSLSPDGLKLYVVNEWDNTVNVINTFTNTITATVPVGGYPIEVSISPDGSKVYVINEADNTVSVINTVSNTVTATFAAGDDEHSYFGNFLANVPVVCASTPVITSFAPTKAGTGDTVTIKGYHFTGTSSVSFGGDAATSFSELNDSTIVAIIGNGASGNIYITTIGGSGTGGTDSLAGFTFFIPPPSITSFSPTSATLASTVTIKGTYFTGATAVSFGGDTASSFSVLNDSTITAVVGMGASGNVSITTSWGTGSIAGFVYNIPIPTITSFSPAKGSVGSLITIKGTNFIGTKAVSFGDTAAYFFVQNDSIIKATVGGGASGNVSVTTPYGTDSKAGFTFVLPQPPVITSFTPTSTCPDSIATVFITGKNFIRVKAVSIGGKAVDSFRVNSTNSITATTAPNSIGTITVTTQYDTITNSDSFTNSEGYTGYAYIANGNNSTVSIMNTNSNTLIATVTVGRMPESVCASPDGTKVYVANSESNSVNVINTATNTVTATVEVGNFPYDISISPDGSKLYVSNSADNTVSVINTATNIVTNTIHIGNYPLGMCLSPDGQKLYIANYGNHTVVVINTATDTALASIKVGIFPSGICISPDGTKVYVTNENTDSVNIINTLTNKVTGSVIVGNAPVGICVSLDGTRVYVANSKSNTVSIINTATNRVLSSIAVGSNPRGISLNPVETKLYVTNWGDNTVSVINTATNTVTATLAVGNSTSFGNFIANVPTACGALPVTLMNIEAVNKNNIVVVNWHTSTELNTSQFIIQRSTDGSTFTDIGTVKAIGVGANSYSFMDETPTNGINYYRLKSVDKDGSLSFSKIVSASLTTNNSPLTTIYPNPAKDNVTIRGNHIASVQMIDNMGRVVKVVSLKDATNPVLSVSNLAAGVYHLRVETNDGNISGVGFVKK